MTINPTQKKKPIKTPLQQRLREKMSQAGISAHALEKKAGLRPSAVQNILHGRSRKPSAEILHAIARILSCTTEELLDSSDGYGSTFECHADAGNTAAFQMELFLEAVEITAKIAKTRNLALSKQKVLSFTDEIYNYSIENKMEKIDEHFAVWFSNKLWGSGQ